MTKAPQKPRAGRKRAASESESGILFASRRSAADVVVVLLAVAVAALGLLNLWSALLARGPGRIAFLRDTAHIPLVVLHGSRTLTALFGLGLLMLARSILRRKRQAWRITVILVALCPFLHLAKGLDWEEAVVCLALLGGLLSFRHAFWASNDKPSARQGALAALGLLVFAAVYGPLGFLLLRGEFVPQATPARAVRQVSYLLLYTPHYRSLYPITRRAHWFEESLLSIFAFAVGYGAFMLLRPVLPRGAAEDAERAKARSLLRTWGGAPLAYFTLLPDKRYLFGPSAEDACWGIAYVVVGRRAVALGDPFGDPAQAGRAIRSFLDLCRRHDWSPAFYQTTGNYLPLYRAARLKALKVGEDALIDLPAFALTGKRFQDLRTAINRMVKAGILFEEYRADLKENKRNADVLVQMGAISAGWLRAHRGEEKTFALGRFAPDSDLFRDSRVFLAREEQSRDILAFVTFVPIFGCVSGWGLDLMRRREDAPNGIMDFLLTSAALTFQSEGAGVLSLGLSPLAGSQPEDDPAEQEAMAKGRALLFERFNHFYSFKGLHAFKEKFAPRWEPRYLIYTGNRGLAAAIYAVFKAHSPRGLSTFLRI